MSREFPAHLIFAHKQLEGMGFDAKLFVEEESNQPALLVFARAGEPGIQWTQSGLDGKPAAVAYAESPPSWFRLLPSERGGSISFSEEAVSRFVSELTGQALVLTASPVAVTAVEQEAGSRTADAAAARVRPVAIAP